MFQWVICTLFYFYQYIIRIIPNAYMDNIMENFSMKLDDFGMFSALYYFAYAPMHIVIGYVLDKFDFRKVLASGLLGLSITLYIFSISQNLYVAYACRFSMGLFSVFAVLCLFKAIKTHFSHRFSFLLGLSVSIGLCAPIFAGYIFNSITFVEEMLFHKRTWQFVFQYLAIIGVIMSILSFLFLKKEIPEENSEDFFSKLKTILLNKKFLFVSLAGGFFIGPLEGFSDSWSVKFLEHLFNQSKDSALYITSFLFLGMGISSPPIGWVIDKYKKHFLGTLILVLIMFVSFSFVSFFPLNLHKAFLCGLFFLLGVGCSYQVPIVYESLKQLDDKYIGLGSACCNMLMMGFGSFYHFLIGNSLEYFSKRTTLIYAYQKTFYSIPLGILIGVMFFVSTKTFNKAK